MPTLYVVGTPIGNLEDVSLRALRVLREVKIIAAEDTRWTRRLLVTYDIRTPMTSYHERNKWAKLDYVLGLIESIKTRKIKIPYPWGDFIITIQPPIGLTYNVRDEQMNFSLQTKLGT